MANRYKIHNLPLGCGEPSCDGGRKRLPCVAQVPMKLNVIVHNAEEGGYWAEVPAIPGCAGPLADSGSVQRPTPYLSLPASGVP